MRSIIVVDVTRVADSCGYSVPMMDLAGERTLLDDQHGRRTAAQWPERVKVNAQSIDGLPALHPDHPAPSPLIADHPQQAASVNGSGGG